MRGLDKEAEGHKQEVSSSSIAIIGYAFRFPGNLGKQDELWEALKQGRDLVTQVPADRWSVDTLQHDKRSEPGRSITFSAGVLSRIDEFDAGFFGISPREAAWLDPQQRLLLELAWEAMENAQTPASALQGSDCAVYVGISGLDYGTRGIEDLASLSSHLMTGNTLSVAANRLSYVFDLRGPSLAIDTACSSSLVALHHACRALQAGEAGTALVGGVNLLLHPYPFVGFTKASMLAADGRCRPFDAEGKGYVRSEGGTVLLLKPLQAALDDGDNIEAVILASGVNADGAQKTGITIPSSAGQAALMKQVLAKTALAPKDIDFVEAHGTGTVVGDPIEAAAISEVYSSQREQVLPIGSVKANLGHLEAASGMAGLVKTLLALRHRALPPQIHLKTLNPKIDFQGRNLAPVRQYLPLEKPNGAPLIAGLNSFGFGGANAHVLLQEYRPAENQPPAYAPDTLPVLTLSAHSDAALMELAQAYAELLEGKSAPEYYDIAYAAAHGRSHLSQRLALQAASVADAVEQLQAFAQGGAEDGLVREAALPQNGGTTFVYSGNGAQWLGMGRQLLEESPEFAQYMQALDTAMAPVAGFSILAELQAEESAARLDDTEIAQPLLFALQAATTQLLQTLGVQAQAVCGHSVGEVAAAWAAGLLELNQAIRVIVARSRAQGETRGTGRMAVAALSAAALEQQLQQLAAPEPAGAWDIVIAGVNSPNNVTLSGNPEHLQHLGNHLKGQGAFFQMLSLDYAFHSAYMDPVKGRLIESLNGLQLAQPGQIDFVSTVTGQALGDTVLDAEYWWLNVREPVRFADAITTLHEQGCRVFVEIGPHAILQHYLRDTLAAADIQGKVLATQRKNTAGLSRVIDTALRTQLLVAQPDWRAHFPQPGRRVNLPNYPWQRERHWHPVTVENLGGIQRPRQHPLLGWRVPAAELAWNNTLDPIALPWLADHKVGEAVVFPGTGYVEMALAAAREWLGDAQLGLEELDIVAPMVFDEEHARELRLDLNARDGSFQIKSRQRLATGDWVLHAAGRIWAAQDSVAVAGIAGLPEQASETDAPTHYSLARAIGLNYGPAFQGLVSARLWEDRVEAQLAPHKDAAAWLLHPAQLDLCFQSLVQFFRADIEAGQGVALLPVKVGRLLLVRPGVAASFKAQLRRRSARSMVVDFEVFDAQGELLASMSACRLRAAPLALNRAKDKVALWQIQPSLRPHPAEVPVTRLPDSSQFVEYIQRHMQPLASQRQAWFREALPLFEALVLSFAYQAVSSCAAQNPQALQTLAGSGRPYAGWLLGLLRQEGLLVEQDGRLSLLQHHELPASEEIWRALLRDHADCLPQLTLMSRAGSHLPRYLNQDSAAAQAFAQELWRSAVAETLYEDDPVYAGTRAALEQALHYVVSETPAHRRLRVLEISAGPSELARVLLDTLPEDRLEYVLALPDEIAAERQRAEFADIPNLTVAALDRAGWSLQSDHALPEAYDLVIYRHVLHKAAAPQLGLAHARRWLSAGGRLFLAERHPDWSADFLYGLDAAWWHQADRHSDGAWSSLLPASAWEDALAQEGFADIQVFVEPDAQALAAGAYLLLARNPERAVPALAEPESDSWLLLADEASAALGECLRDALTAQHQQVQLVSAPAETALNARNIVWLGGWQAAADRAAAAVSRLLETVQAMAAHPQQPQRLWVVTRNSASQPAQAALWGLGRVVMNEQPGLSCTLIDVADTLDAIEAPQKLANELLRPDGAAEVLLSPQARHTLVMQEHNLPRVHNVSQPKSEAERFHLDFLVPGQLRNLSWLPLPQRVLQAHEIEVQPRATGLNFRDIMYVMGLLPDEAVENGFAGASLGLEFSGVVTRVGAGVSEYEVGDAVMGFGSACFASHVVTRADAVAPMPAHWRFEAAATVPTVFLTVYYALVQLARVEPGERVLIHGGAGGVGIAAIQLAQHLGAEVFATAGNEEKRDFVRLLGADHVFDSRSLAFEDDILAATQGEGVDVVLNSLAGEAIRRNLRVLRPFGRFLELGKRDFFENTPLGLRPFKDNISYFGIDADQLLTGRPQLAARLFAEVIALFKQGVLSPLPYRVFPAKRVVEAFRTMQQARHIGKVVVSMEGARPTLAAPHSPVQPPALDVGPAWLVTGGLSGFGLESARWLAAHGAKRLVLVSRRGPETPGAEHVLAELRAQGVAAQALACDISDAQAVATLIEEVKRSGPPLSGVLHAAMVIDDRLLTDLDAAAMQAVLQPKLSGAWHLHQATQAMGLQHFVMYSSITTSIGNPGQGNYVAANMGLEALAELRRRQGLPATCIGWGPIGDAGYLTRNTAVRDSLASRLGAEPLSAAQALQQLGRLLVPGSTVAAANFSWPQLSRLLASAASSRFSLLNRGLKGSDAAAEQLDIRALIEGKTPEEIKALVQRLVIEEVAQILAVDAGRIEISRSLHDYGLDSLMAVELALGLEKQFGVDLPVMMLNESPTVDSVAGRIIDKLAGGQDEAEGVDHLVQNLLGRHEGGVAQEELRDIADRARELAQQDTKFTS